VTIKMTSTAKIRNAHGPRIVLDGGGKVTLSGGGRTAGRSCSTAAAR
jgi:hypothetical protein